MATATKKPATKTAPAKAPKKAAKPAPVPVEALTKNQAGRLIQDTMAASLLTVEQIAAKTGLTVGRVQEHVSYEMKLGRSKLNTKKQVQVISSPKYRQQS
jgi:hypothetical protein